MLDKYFDRIIVKKGFATLHNVSTVWLRRRIRLSLAIAAVEMQNNVLKYFQGYLGSFLTDVKRCIGQGCK